MAYHKKHAVYSVFFFLSSSLALAVPVRFVFVFDGAGAEYVVRADCGHASRCDTHNEPKLVVHQHWI